MTNWTLTVPQPSVPKSENAVRGYHWARARSWLQPWNDATWATALNRMRQVTRHGRGFVPVPVTIQVTLTFRDRRTRDPHNYTGTVVKAMVDGLKRAGVVPDDSPEWVTVLDPILCVVGRNQSLTATVAIRPRPTTEER